MEYLNQAGLSQRMSTLSVMAMIAVVIIHSNTIGTLPSPSKWNCFFQEAFSRLGTSWAVPFFFLQAGYWAQKSSYELRGGGGGTSLLKKKLRGLLMPYLAWAVIGAVIVLPLIFFNNYVTHRPLVARTVFDAPSLWGVFDKLFGITNNGPSGNLALWFVRELMFIFLTFPILRMIGKFSTVLLSLLGIIGILIGYEVFVPLLSVKYCSWGFFLLGMVIAQKNWGGIRFSNKHLTLFAFLYFTILLLGTALQLNYFTLPIIGKILIDTFPLIGILFWTGVYDCLSGSSWRIPAGLRKTFWIYCLHGTLVGYFTSGGLFLLGKSDFVSITLAILAPIPTILVCIFAYRLSERLFPRATNILMGGR